MNLLIPFLMDQLFFAVILIHTGHHSIFLWSILVIFIVLWLHFNITRLSILIKQFCMCVGLAGHEMAPQTSTRTLPLCWVFCKTSGFCLASLQGCYVNLIEERFNYIFIISVDVNKLVQSEKRYTKCNIVVYEFILHFLMWILCLWCNSVILFRDLSI